MKIGRRELTAAWVAIGVLWLSLQPFERTAKGAYKLSDHLSVTFLCWITAALVGVTFYQLSKGQVQVPHFLGKRFRRISVLSVVVALAACIIASAVLYGICAINHSRALAQLEHGDKCAKETDWPTAIACYGKAIELQPALSRAYIQRGKAFEEIWPMDYDSAISDYSRAIELDANDAEALYLRGLAYYSTVQPKDGISDLTEAIRLKPDFAQAYRFRGSMLLSLGDTTRAIADTSEAVKLDPDDDANWYYRSLLYERIGKLNEALQDATRAVEVNPSRDNFWQRAKVRTALDMDQEAIQDYSSAIQLDPENHLLLRERASEWRNLNEAAKAQLDENKAADVESRHKVTRDFVRREKDAAAHNEALRKQRKD